MITAEQAVNTLVYMSKLTGDTYKSSVSHVLASKEYKTQWTKSHPEFKLDPLPKQYNKR